MRLATAALHARNRPGHGGSSFAANRLFEYSLVVKWVGVIGDGPTDADREGETPSGDVRSRVAEIAQSRQGGGLAQTPTVSMLERRSGPFDAQS